MRLTFIAAIAAFALGSLAVSKPATAAPALDTTAGSPITPIAAHRYGRHYVPGHRTKGGKRVKDYCVSNRARTI